MGNHGFCLKLVGSPGSIDSLEAQPEVRIARLPVLVEVYVFSGHTAAPATPLGRLRSWLVLPPWKNPVVPSYVPEACQSPPGSTAAAQENVGDTWGHGSCPSRRRAAGRGVCGGSRRKVPRPRAATRLTPSRSASASARTPPARRAEFRRGAPSPAAATRHHWEVIQTASPVTGVVDPSASEAAAETYR